MRRPNAHTAARVPELARARAGVERELARVERVALGRDAPPSPRRPPPPRAPRRSACRRDRAAARASCPVDVEAHGVALRQARAGRGILVDDLPVALVERRRRGRRPARRPSGRRSRRRSSATSRRWPTSAGTALPCSGLGDRERALLVDRLGAAQDGDEQHAGEEAAGAGQGHAERPEAPRRAGAALHARALLVGGAAHALARSASKRCSSGSPFSGKGTSTLSKSRGTSVRSKIARASSRISPPA